jgi:hypothetical protein
MADRAKRTGRSRAFALAGLAFAALASGQGPAGPSRFPTIPTEHAHARDLLGNAMRYASPSNKMVDPVSGYPFEGWNQDPKRGLYLRSFTQLTAIGQWMELLATVAAGNADTPHLSRQEALDQLSRLVKTLRADQADPRLAAKGLLGNFLDLATGKRLGPLASNVDKSKFLETFGATKGEALWKALEQAGWLKPRLDGLEADITRGAKYGYEHFEGPLAPFKDEATRQKVMALLDGRVVMLIFGDNSNLSASAAKTIGALLVPQVKEKPEAIAIRDQLEGFLEAQAPGYARLYDEKSGLFYFGWDATRDRLFGWDDLQGKRVIGHMDYFVNEFRGPATFIAARFGLPSIAIGNLGFKMKPYRMKDGRDLYTLAPWEGSAFQALGLGLGLHETSLPGWREILKNVVHIEIDFADGKGLPGFLSESYTGDGTQYTGSVGIPEITVSPRPRITDAASLYTLGVAYSVAPDEVERFLERHWPVISTLLTDHGPWEGYNVARREPIKFQTTAHTLALILGLIGRGSTNMGEYIRSKGLVGRLDELFPFDLPGADLLASSPAFAWTAKDATLASGKEGTAFHVKGDQLPLFGIAWVPNAPEGVNLSGGLLTLRYRSAQALDPVTIELKPAKDPSMDDSGLISRAITVRIEATGPGEKEIRVPLPATPGLARIKEVVIYHERSTKGPVDLTVTHLSVAPTGPK